MRQNKKKGNYTVSTKKTEKNITADAMRAIEAELERAHQELQEARAKLPAAEEALEAATQAELDLRSALHAGDDSVTTEQMVTAGAEITRAKALRDGILAMIDRLERKVERTNVPSLGVLVADVLAAGEVTGLVEWHVAVDVDQAREILAERKRAGRRVGLILEEAGSVVRGAGPTSSVVTTRGTVRLTVHGDALTRRFADRELTDALEASGRITSATMPNDPVSGAGNPVQRYRVNVAGAYTDEIPTVQGALRYTGPSASRKVAVGADVVESDISSPVDQGDGTKLVTVTASVRLAQRHILQRYIQLVEAEGDQAAPVYGSLGRCVSSEVTSTEGADKGGVVVNVAQSYVHAAA